MAPVFPGCSRRFADGMPEWFRQVEHIIRRGGWPKGSNRDVGRHDRAARVIWSAAADLFLVSDDSRWKTGQVMHVNGGQYLG
jgi:NAD(P)-dependent dehydrogenase (short-subunit alcohol dehydrogenase family)